MVEIILLDFSDVNKIVDLFSASTFFNILQAGMTFYYVA